MSRITTKLELSIGYEFRHIENMQTALSHRSYINEVEEAGDDNQRFEFLGDSVLGLVIAEELFRRHPTVAEGFLSGVQATLVCESALFEVAKAIDLGEALLLGKGEELSGGREKSSLLADAYEALLAGIYLDGGLEAARNVILSLHAEGLNRPQDEHAPEDSKSKLQRITQGQTTKTPVYKTIDERGPMHARIFVAEVSIEGKACGRGEGKTKKLAQQNAALVALKSLDQK